MADYKLRVDVDEAELTKKLKKAVEKAFGDINLGGGGAKDPLAQFSKTMDKYGKSAEDVIKVQEKIFRQQKDLILLRSRERQALERTIRSRQVEQKLLALRNAEVRNAAGRNASFKNILGFGGSLMGMGGPGGMIGGGIDVGLSYWRKRQNSKEHQRREAALKGEANPMQAFWGGMNFGEGKKGKMKDIMKMSGDFFKQTKMGKLGGKAGSMISKVAGSPVKIAGIAAGLAAGGGLAKMIIDASPLLQAMLKLLNVGIMLILRPIGDFIGFMLRPLLIEFVKKIAVPMYRDGFKAAKSWGTKLGMTLLEFFQFPEKFVWDNFMRPLAALFQGIPILGGGIEGWIKEVDESYRQRAEEMGLPQLTGEYYDKLSRAGISTSKGPGVQTGYGEGDFIVGSPEWQAHRDAVLGNTGTTDVNTEAIQQNTLTLQQAIAASKALYPEWFKGTDEYKARFGGHCGPAEQQAALEAEIEKNKKLYPEWFRCTPEYAEKQNRLSLEGQHTYANCNDEWTGAFGRVGKDALLKEAQRAAGVYGSFGGWSDEFVYNKDRTWRDIQAEKEAEALASGKPYGYMTSDVMQNAYNSLGAPQRGTVDGQRNIFTGSLSWLGQTGNEIPDEGEMQQLIIEPLDNMNKTWLDGTNIQEELNKELKDKGIDIMDHRYEELSAAHASKIAGIGIKAEMEDAEDEIESAVEAGSKVADGLWKLWDKVDQALNRMRVYTNSKGNRPYKRVATAALQELGVKAYVQDEEDDRWLITWPKTDSQPARSATMNLSAAALVKYQELAAQGSLSMIKLARGGIINEPILGMGQKSGRHYLMGEAGPETITPGSNTSPGTTGGNTFNITINAKDVGDIERQLKPTILRILKESTSRAGIV